MNTYTVTCPDPECKTTFEVEEADFDVIYANDETISCRGCDIEYEWIYDDQKPDGQEVTLTRAAEFQDAEPDIEDDEDTADEDDEEDENA